MKRIFIVLTVAAAVMMGAMPAWGQQVVSPDGSMASMDNLHQEKVPLPWQVEVSVRQVLSLGWCPQMATVGMRKGDIVYGLGAGHSEWFYDAYPVLIKTIPFYAYNRIYFPMGEKRRFSFYTDEFLGYNYCYYSADAPHYTGLHKGEGKFFLSWQPGISLRMWGKSNLFLGIVVSTTFEYPIPAFGLHLGLAL